MTDDFEATMRAGLKELARELSQRPFASTVFFDGRYWPRAKARAIERAFWPLAYPKPVPAQWDGNPKGGDRNGLRAEHDSPVPTEGRDAP